MHTPRILVADDDDSVRVTLAGNLELEGYDVTEARDGAEAIALIGQRAFELIISDSSMPLATGVEVLASVRQTRLDTPFILISGLLSEELMARALSEGLFALLDKPLPTDHILAVVARALERNTVLMVSDALALPLALALRVIGVGIEAYADIESARDFAQRNAVDVCVVDLVRYPLEGPELCDAVRGIHPGVGIVVITERGAEPGCRDGRNWDSTCLPKPFAVLDLLRAIAHVRAGRRAARARGGPCVSSCGTR